MAMVNPNFGPVGHGGGVPGGGVTPGGGRTPGGGGTPVGLGHWRNDLFGCCSNCRVCCITCCFPCVQFGLNKKKYQGGSCCKSAYHYWHLFHCGLCWVVHMGLRKRIRDKHRIKGSDEEDFLITCCCPLCAICQEATQE